MSLNRCYLALKSILPLLALLAHGAQATLNDGVAAYSRGDFAAAFAEFSEAAKQDHPTAQNALGTMYAEGKGVRQDYSRAINWFYKAQALGLREAMFNLARIYEEGLGTPRNNALAHKYYLESALDGYPPAIERLIKVFQQGELGQKADPKWVSYWNERLSGRDASPVLRPTLPMTSSTPSSALTASNAAKVPALPSPPAPPMQPASPSVGTVLRPAIAPGGQKVTRTTAPPSTPAAPITTTRPPIDESELLKKQVLQNLEDYQQRERKLFVGSSNIRPTLADYLKALRAQLSSQLATKISPQRARQRIIVSLTILQNGRLREVELSRGSGHARSDRKLVTAIRKIGRVSPLPAETRDEFDVLVVSLAIPIEH